MFYQLLIGSVIVSLAIATAAIFIGIAARVLERIDQWLAKPPHAVKTTIALMGVSLWLLAAITVMCADGGDFAHTISRPPGGMLGDCGLSTVGNSRGAPRA